MNRIVLIALALMMASSLVAAAQEPQPQPANKPAPEPKQSNQPGQAGKAGAQPQPEQKPQGAVIDRRKLPLADRPNLSLADVNTDIGVDKRVIVMMAALNIAGYDYESGNRQLSALRRQIREDLQGIDPGLVQRLRAYFQKHHKGENDVTAVAPYLSLALSMTEPPAFTIDAPADRLPNEVREIADFALLLEEFYRVTGFSKLMPKYVAAYVNVAQNYGAPAGVALGAALSYLHTDPILELPPLYTPRKTSASSSKADDKKGDKKPVQEAAVDTPNRVRLFIIIPDLLNATGVANLRVVRDTYFLLLGPTTEPNVEAMRRAFLTFVLDPLTERQVKEVAAIREPLKKLMESRGDRLDKEYSERNAYFLISDSLARATDARMDALGLAARRKSAEDESLYDLSLGYDRGAVLVYHFYDQMKAYESVGVNIRDYISAMLGNIDFKRESKRLDEYAQRLDHGKQLRAEAKSVATPPPTISNADENLVARIAEADQLIKARKYDEAKTALESALKDQPNNARVLYGLADVMSKKATALEDPDRVEEILFAAVEYYSRAAKNASPETEKWLMQRSY
ncbi:MAG TPA: tetratricopeptide repeat protein, partial [Blastocatellia bacterium]